MMLIISRSGFVPWGRLINYGEVTKVAIDCLVLIRIHTRKVKSKWSNLGFWVTDHLPLP